MQGLREWLYTEPMPPQVQASELAAKYWAIAIEDMTLGNIWAYYVCASMDRYYKQEFVWHDIALDNPRTHT
jgi:hypothetical protein